MKVPIPSIRLTARGKRLSLMAGIAGGCAGCDQATKEFAARALSASGPLSALGDSISLEYVENAGGFLSVGASLEAGIRDLLFLGVAPVILLLSVVLVFRGRRVTLLDAAGMALVLGGALGNLIDRVRFGFVRDFATVGFGPVRTGVFNLADVVLLLGVALLIAGMLGDRHGDDVPRKSHGLLS